MSEDKISSQGNAPRPDHEVRGERWEKEFGNPSIESHRVSNQLEYNLMARKPQKMKL